MKTIDEIFVGVSQVIMETIDVTPDQIRMESILRDNLGADSLDSVEIVMGLEDKFELKLSESGTENIRTVSDLVNFIAEALSEHNATKSTVSA